MPIAFPVSENQFQKENFETKVKNNEKKWKILNESSLIQERQISSKVCDKITNALNKFIICNKILNAQN